MDDVQHHLALVGGNRCPGARKIGQDEGSITRRSTRGIGDDTREGGPLDRRCTTWELVENDEGCRLLSSGEPERVHDMLHVENQSIRAPGRGGARRMGGERAERVTHPVRPTPALGMPSCTRSANQKSTNVEERRSSTGGVGERAPGPVTERDRGRDAHESHHGQKNLQNVEKQRFSTKNISTMRTAHDTLSRVVQTNYIPVPQHQTCSKMRRHHLCGSMIPTTLSTLLPTKHPCREGIGVNETAQDSEERCSSTKRAEYELLELADEGESTQDMSSTCHNHKTRRNVESAMYSTQDQASRAQELASDRNDHPDASRASTERCMDEGTEERDSSAIHCVERCCTTINESGSGLGMHLLCQGFKRLKSVENDMFSTKNISTRRMVLKTPSRVVQTSYSPRLPPNTCSETCRLASYGHPWPRPSPKSFPMVPTRMEAPVVDKTVRKRLEGSSRRLDDSGMHIYLKTNIGHGTVHSTPFPRPRMMDKVKNRPYTTETTSFRWKRRDTAQERLEVQGAPQKHEIECVNDLGSRLQSWRTRPTTTRHPFHPRDSRECWNASTPHLDIPERCHGPQDPRDVEKHRFSTRLISIRWTVPHTLSRVVQTNYSLSSYDKTPKIVEEHYSSTWQVESEPPGLEDRRKRFWDASMTIPSPLDLQDIEKPSFSMESINKSQTVHDTPSMHPPHEFAQLVPLPTLLPTEHPRRKDLEVEETLEIIEEHHSSMKAQGLRSLISTGGTFGPPFCLFG